MGWSFTPEKHWESSQVWGSTQHPGHLAPNGCCTAVLGGGIWLVKGWWQWLKCTQAHPTLLHPPPVSHLHAVNPQQLLSPPPHAVGPLASSLLQTHLSFKTQIWVLFFREPSWDFSAQSWQSSPALWGDPPAPQRELHHFSCHVTLKWFPPRSSLKAQTWHFSSCFQHLGQSSHLTAVQHLWEKHCVVGKGMSTRRVLQWARDCCSVWKLQGEKSSKWVSKAKLLFYQQKGSFVPF